MERRPDAAVGRHDHQRVERQPVRQQRSDPADERRLQRLARRRAGRPRSASRPPAPRGASRPPAASADPTPLRRTVAGPGRGRRGWRGRRRTSWTPHRSRNRSRPSRSTVPARAAAARALSSSSHSATAASVAGTAATSDAIATAIRSVVAEVCPSSPRARRALDAVAGLSSSAASTSAGTRASTSSREADEPGRRLDLSVEVVGRQLADGRAGPVQQVPAVVREHECSLAVVDRRAQGLAAVEVARDGRQVDGLDGSRP